MTESHPPLADEGGDVMVAESGAEGQGHGLRIYDAVSEAFYAQAAGDLRRITSQTRTWPFCGASAASWVVFRIVLAG